MGLETTAIIGIAAAVAAVGAGTANAIATNNASKRNAQAQREVNEQNYQIWQEQKAYQTSEREATQEYNDPSKQAARYKAAGFNPYVMMNQIDAGNTVAQTSPSPPTMQAYQQPTIPWGDLLSDVASEGSKAYELQGIKLDNDAKVIDLVYKNNEKILDLSERRARIANMEGDTKYKARMLDEIDESIKILQDQNDQLRSTSDERKAETKARSQYQQAQARLTQLQGDAQAFTNSLSDEQRKALQASIKETYSRINLNSASSASQFANAALQNMQEKGVRIDNAQKNKLNWILREAAKADMILKKYQSKYPSYFGREVGAPIYDAIKGFFFNETGYWSTDGVWSGNVEYPGHK